jgi:hypothetical protein
MFHRTRASLRSALHRLRGPAALFIATIGMELTLVAGLLVVLLRRPQTTKRPKIRVPLHPLAVATPDGE